MNFQLPECYHTSDAKSFRILLNLIENQAGQIYGILNGPVSHFQPEIAADDDVISPFLSEGGGLFQRIGCHVILNCIHTYSPLYCISATFCQLTGIFSEQKHRYTGIVLPLYMKSCINERIFSVLPDSDRPLHNSPVQT